MTTKREWLWNWIGGGYNVAFVETREEALAEAHRLSKSTVLRIDERTLHVAKPGEVAAIDRSYAGMFD